MSRRFSFAPTAGLEKQPGGVFIGLRALKKYRTEKIECYFLFVCAKPTL